GIGIGKETAAFGCLILRLLFLIYELPAFVQSSRHIMRVYPFAFVYVTSCLSDNFAILYDIFAFFYKATGNFVSDGHKAFFQSNFYIILLIDNYLFHNTCTPLSSKDKYSSTVCVSPAK